MLMPIRTSLNSVSNQNSVASTTLAWGTATTNSTINVAGSWNAVFSTLPPFAVTLLKVTITGAVASATNKNNYIDIGVGTTTADAVVVVEKLSGSNAGSNLLGIGRTYLIPVRIAPGQQIYVRTTCVALTGLPSVQIVAYGGHKTDPAGFAGSQVVALGATTATSEGTAVTPGSTAAEGAWTQIVASTTDDYIGFLISHFCSDTTMSVGQYVWDIGVGAAGAEVSIGENITHAFHDATEAIVSFSMPVMVAVPAGQRLSVRCSCSGTPDGPTISAIINGIRP